MYRRPRFLEELHAIREEMSRECDYDAELFAEMVRSNERPLRGPARNVRGIRLFAPPQATTAKKNGHRGPRSQSGKARRRGVKKGINGHQD